MNNVMTNGFCELNENEMMAVDGGFDLLMNVKGVGMVIAGGVACAVTAIYVVSNPVPPVAAVQAGDAVAFGGYLYFEGIKNIYNSHLN